MTDLRNSDRLFTSPALPDFRVRREPNTFEGEGIAVALGGGFSRGFAHLGVLEVLEESGIPISAIVGTSIGGLLGAAYADGISAAELCQLGRQVRLRDFLRFQNHPVEGQTNDRLGRFIHGWFRARNIEELSIPTRIVTTNLDTGAAHVFARGPLEIAIRATCAFPGLFKPVEHEGHLLADGCIVAPVPTAFAVQMNVRWVLGVSVGSPEKKATSLRDRLLKPSWMRHADIMLEPEVQQIDWNDFSRVDEARAAGAEAMRRALPNVCKMLKRHASAHNLPQASSQMEGGVA